MHINTPWFGDSFNVELCTKQGVEPFLIIKGCRLANGRNGDFVSWPARKDAQTGKWWNHCFSSEAFSQHVQELATKSRPAQDTRTHAERKRPASLADMDDDIPW